MKKKNDSVVPEMESRLESNRSGKLTSDQWLDIVLQPLTPILLILLPAGVLFLPRLYTLFFRGGWLMFVLLLLFIAGSFVFRAFRYARAPIYFKELTALSPSPPFWKFWQPVTLYDDETGQVLRFGKRLAPRPILRRDMLYVVYYLEEPEDNVLLSIAPADHPKVNRWMPDRFFEARFKRRS